MSEGSTIRLVIIDDHPLMREGVLRTLRAEADIQIVGEGGSADEAVALARQLTPDILLLDLDIPGDGLHALGPLGEASPETRVIVLTASNDEDDLASAFKDGARGYVVKGVSIRELARIIRHVNAGRSYVPPDLAGSLIAGMVGSANERPAQRPVDQLNEREKSILRELATGANNREIARALHLTENTVKSYMSSLMHKLNVRNRVEAARLWHQIGAGA
jgi:two-component system, NarL family, nitrate/nitrite response regulator NarL